MIPSALWRVMDVASVAVLTRPAWSRPWMSLRTSTTDRRRLAPNGENVVTWSMAAWSSEMVRPLVCPEVRLW
jgi:hypothetical protein